MSPSAQSTHPGRSAGAGTDARLQLAWQLYADVTERVTARPSYSLLLDHALLSMEFRQALGEDCGAADPRRSLSDALQALPHEQGVGPWLYRGAAQAGWTALHVAHSRGARPPRLPGVDETVLAWLRDYPTGCDIDLPRGVTGLGVYALVHPEPAVRDTLLAAVLDVIEERVERDGNGAFFRLAQTPERAKDGSAGCRVIGVAHGTAGLVSFLSSVVMNGSPRAQQRARPLLDETLRWLTAQRTDVGHTVFPHRVELRYAPARATWCSGDPGVALALDVAVRATGSLAAAALVRHTARAVLSRSDDECGVVDACLCHGAAGLSWFGTRVQHDLGLAGAEAFADRWTRWIGDHRAAEELTYFSPWGMIRDVSFLEGDLGAALVLLRQAVGGRGVWEQLLLTVPVGARG